MSAVIKKFNKYQAELAAERAVYSEVSMRLSELKSKRDEVYRKRADFEGKNRNRYGVFAPDQMSIEKQNEYQKINEDEDWLINEIHKAEDLKKDANEKITQYETAASLKVPVNAVKEKVTERDEVDTELAQIKSNIERTLKEISLYESEGVEDLSGVRTELEDALAAGAEESEILEIESKIDSIESIQREKERFVTRLKAKLQGLQRTLARTTDKKNNISTELKVLQLAYIKSCAEEDAEKLLVISRDMEAAVARLLGLNALYVANGGKTFSKPFQHFDVPMFSLHAFSSIKPMKPAMSSKSINIEKQMKAIQSELKSDGVLD